MMPSSRPSEKNLHRVNEVECEVHQDYFHCESSDLLANKGEIFTTLSSRSS